MDHFALQEYEWGLAQYLGAGVAACYRGYRVYDTDRTESLVKKYVEFYKASVMVRKKIFSMGRPFLSELSFYSSQAIVTPTHSPPKYYRGMQLYKISLD